MGNLSDFALSLKAAQEPTGLAQLVLLVPFTQKGLLLAHDCLPLLKCYLARLGPTEGPVVLSGGWGGSLAA